MDKKEFDYIDSELKKISIRDFKYEGNRASGEPIFAFERIVDENDSYCIVLDGSQDKEVEIQAETDYNSGANEYIDKLVSLNSWREAIEYLQNNSQKLAKDAEKKYLLNKQKLEKTAKIMGMTTPVAGKLERIARRILAFDESKFVSDMKEMSELKMQSEELYDKAENIGEEVQHVIWRVIHDGSVDESKKLLDTLSKYKKDDFAIPYFNYEDIMNRLRTNAFANKPISYKGYQIMLVPCKNGGNICGFQYIVSKNGNVIYDGSKSNSYSPVLDNAIANAKEYVDKQADDNGSTGRLLEAIGIANAKYVETGYEYKGKESYHKTVELKNDRYAIEEFAELAKKNNVTSADGIKVLEKRTDGYRQIGPEYDTTRFTVLEGWYIRLKIGNSEWSWGAGNTK